MNHTILAETRRDEEAQKLLEMSDRELCEAIRTHFNSHPTLPGERSLKVQAERSLHNMDLSGDDQCFNQLDRKSIAKAFGKTRIRETPLNDSTLNPRLLDPNDLKREPFDEFPLGDGYNTVRIDRVNIRLQHNGVSDVYALALRNDGGWATAGTLPENFLKNNPMNVKECDAELEIADYSGGQGKNIRARVIVNTDRMSGDILDLDDSILADFEQTQETDMKQ